MQIPDDVFVFQTTDEGTTCDFCGVEYAEDAPGKDYLCKPITLVANNFETTLAGDWWACEECAKLIDADKWEELALRSVQQVNPAVRERFLVQVRRTHQEFAKNRRPIQ